MSHYPQIRVAPITREGVDRTEYKCADCPEVFAVDPADPMKAHDAYLGHLAAHERQVRPT